MITYRKATLDDVKIIAELGHLLYPENPAVELLRDEAKQHLRSGRWVVFLAFDGTLPVGMCEVALRTDYVEGTEGGPVGYVEGVFVMPEYRNRHIAKSLVQLGEDWSREKGCKEFASDCMLDNTESLRFHLKIGFEETGRNIHFVKRL